ncbi:Carcinine [Hypsibius exemplaris]|uniref:Carcinine n=1 Tax=Hypsibius exemplaris TaxID=2072580 RepID=A0A1W0XCZ4_HYPEX|nr:Carcinine [Hypsibius exemplaris]
MDFDVILGDVGEFGRYQKLLLVFVILPACLPGGFHGFSQIFSVATPEDYWCRIPNADIYNLSTGEVHQMLPFDNVTKQHSRCKMYDVNYAKALLYKNYTELRGHTPPFSEVSCKHGWDFNHTAYQSTVVTEWELVCEWDFLPTLSLFIHAIGTFCGSLIFGYLADHLGRKKTFLFAAMIQWGSGLATAASPGFLVFCIFRFLNGLTGVPMWIIPLIMGLELIGPSKRAPVGTTISLFYTLGVVGLAGIAYGIRNWIHLQLAVTLPFTFFVVYWWILPESPRWLMSQGRFDDMMKVVKKIAKVNGVHLNADYEEVIFTKYKMARSAEISARRYNLFDLFRTPNIRKKTCLIVFNSFSNYAVYNGLNFFVPHLGTDEHLSFLLAAVVELPAYAVLYLTLNRFGRRSVLMSAMVLGGSICIATALVPADQPIITTVLFLVSKFCITCSFFVTDLVASELFPTVVRGAGASLTQTVSTIGLCISPLITHFAKHFLYLPMIIFGVLAIVGGAVTMVLPETANQHLPETLEEGEEFGREMRWRDCLRLGQAGRRRIGPPLVKSRDGDMLLRPIAHAVGNGKVVITKV